MSIQRHRLPILAPIYSYLFISNRRRHRKGFGRGGCKVGGVVYDSFIINVIPRATAERKAQGLDTHPVQHSDRALAGLSSYIDQKFHPHFEGVPCAFTCEMATLMQFRDADLCGWKAYRASRMRKPLKLCLAYVTSTRWLKHLRTTLAPPTTTHGESAAGSSRMA